MAQTLDCLICGRKEPKRTLLNHIGEHLGFWTHVCRTCAFTTTYESEAMDHEVDTGHRADAVDLPCHAYLDRICKFIYNDCQFADRHGGSVERVLRRPLVSVHDEREDDLLSTQATLADLAEQSDLSREFLKMEKLETLESAQSPSSSRSSATPLHNGCVDAQQHFRQNPAGLHHPDDVDVVELVGIQRSASIGSMSQQHQQQHRKMTPVAATPAEAYQKALLSKAPSQLISISEAQSSAETLAGPTATATILTPTNRPLASLNSALTAVLNNATLATSNGCGGGGRGSVATTGAGGLNKHVIQQLTGQSPASARISAGTMSNITALLSAASTLANQSTAKRNSGGPPQTTAATAVSNKPSTLQQQIKYEDVLNSSSETLAAAARSLSQLQASQHSMTITAPVRSVWCKKCNIAVRDNSAYKLYHVSSKHLTNLPFYKCLVCGRTYTRSQQKTEAMGHIRREHGGDASQLEDNYSQCTYQCRAVYPQLFQEDPNQRRWRRRQHHRPAGPGPVRFGAKEDLTDAEGCFAESAEAQ